MINNVVTETMNKYLNYLDEFAPNINWMITVKNEALEVLEVFKNANNITSCQQRYYINLINQKIEDELA